MAVVPPPAMDVRAAGLLALAGGTLALWLGQAAGNPDRATMLLAAALVAAVLTGAAVIRPFAGFLVLAGSSMILVAASILPPFSLNLYDALLLPLLVGTVVGVEAWRLRQSRVADRSDLGVGLDTARRAFVRAAMWFYGAAFVSVLMMAGQGLVMPAVGSALRLGRAVQGLLLFPLGMLWISSRARFRATLVAVAAGGTLFCIVNALAAVFFPGRRAGITWWVNEPGISIGDPNEGGTAMLFLWALLLARQSVRWRTWRLAAMVVVVAMLILTQSRSGLLAWLAFNVLAMRHAPRRVWVLGGAVVAAVLPLVPQNYWERLMRTVVLEPGSFEAGSALMRVFGWQAAWRVFLDHPILGVGYQGFQHYADRYNPLGLILVTTESAYLEVATAMGLVGLALFANLLFRSFRLGHAAVAAAPPQGEGRAFARLHTPFMVGMMIANLTGTNFFGMIGLAQLALWHVLLVRSVELDRQVAA